MRSPHEIRKLLGVCTRCGDEMAVSGLLGKRCLQELRPRAINSVFHGVYNFVERITRDWKGHRALDPSRKNVSGSNNDNK